MPRRRKPISNNLWLPQWQDNDWRWSDIAPAAPHPEAMKALTKWKADNAGEDGIPLHETRLRLVPPEETR